MKHLAVLIVALALIPAAWAEENGPICDPMFYDSGIEPFGWIVTYHVGRKIHLPDFHLQAVATTGQRLALQVRDKEGREFKLVVPDTQRHTKEPLAFEVHGRQYVLETGHSVLYDRALADDELVVWPLDAYRAQRDKIAVR